MEWQWNTDAFDAVHITSPNGEFEIVGTDGDKILLEGDGDKRRLRSEPIIQGRWLVMQPIHGSSEWTLELPKSKNWVVEISCASGEIEIHSVHARFDIQLGSGEIHLQDCRGTFNVRSGSGDIELENCLQADVPQVPAFTYQEPVAEPAGIPPIPPIPPMHGKAGARVKFNFGDEAEWEEYGAQWEEWGERFATQATRWAEKFAREFGSGFGFEKHANKPGLNVQIGSGDVSMEHVDAQLVTIRLGSGDVNVEDGRIAELAIDAQRGDLQIENILPAGNWEIATRHGDIQLTLPDDTNARIDAATRHGDIESAVPLVGVGRPGRAARHGGRMVGTLGQVGENPLEIHLESLHGDIQIDLTGHNSRYTGQPAQPRTAKRAMEPVPPIPPTPPTPNADIPAPGNDLPGASEPSSPQASDKPQSSTYDSQFAVLQALQKGEITVAEAELLLKSL